ncbi:MAG TPA: ABC transporter permease [Thermoanaerobaculia bacterium]
MRRPDAGLEPPRAAEGLLRRLLPEGVVGRSILQDLRREYRALAERRGRPPRLWYWRQVLSLGGHYGLARLGSAPGAVLGDLRYALRRLGRSPGFAAVALVTIALGIGANVAIFSVVKAVLLEPLPYDEPDRLTAVWEWNTARDRRDNVVNPGNFRDWRERATSYEDMAALTMAQPAVVSAPGEPVEIQARYTTDNFFPLLGLEPALGRWPEIDAAAEATQAVLSHGFWMSRFGGDPGVVGRSLTLNGQTVVVVGVVPAEYVVFGDEVDVFAAVDIQGDQTSTGRFMNVVGRLAEGVTVEQARQEMEAIGAGLREEHPEFNAAWSVNVVPLQEQVVGDVRKGLWLMLGAVGLLLLIACANVANLFLARATERQREMAVRTSLGAGRGRLVGQLMVESLTVAGGGAALGMLLAWQGTRLLAGVAPDAFALPRVQNAGIDGPVVLFAVAVTVLTGLLFGLLPAAQASAVQPARTLNAEGRGASRRTGRVRDGLVVVEVALSLVLLVGAGLLARSFTSLVAVDAGVDPENVLTARVTLQGPGYQDAGERARFFTELVDGLAGIPGVEAAGAITFLPFTGLASATGFYPLDRPAPAPGDGPAAEVRNVAGDYFGAMGVALLRGRLLDDRDRPGNRDVVVVNRALAESQWPGEDPIGKRIFLSWTGAEELEVVGVVEDVLHHGLDAEARPTVFLPYAQRPYFPFMSLTLRSRVEPPVLAAAVEEQVRAMDPGLPLSRVRVMDDVVASSVARPRVTAFLMSVMAALAAILAAVGLYGVLSYTVAGRVREIGVRMALGAEPGSVVRLVVREGMRLVVVGLVLGAVGSLLLGGLVEGLLFQVRTTDPVALGGGALLLFLVGLAACVVPVARAVRVDPSEALRVE